MGKGYDVDPTEKFKGFLKKVKSEAGDTSFVMNEAARIIGKFTRKNFQLKGIGQYQKLAPDSGGDPVTKSEYAAQKLKKYGILPILVVSGTLKETVTSLSGGSNGIREIGKASLVYGSNLPYARAQQEGSKKTNLPARPFLFLDEPIVNSIMATYDKWLEQKLAA